MSRSHKRLEKAADAFTSAMAARFPSVEQEVSFEDRGGYEVTVFVFVPAELMDSYWEINDVAGELTERLIVETGVNIIGGAFAKASDLVPARSK